MCHPEIYRALYADAMFVPSEGHKHGGRKVTETSAIEVLLSKRKIITLELRRIKIYASSNTSTIQLAKTQAITHLLTYATAFSGGHFHVSEPRP